MEVFGKLIVSLLVFEINIIQFAFSGDACFCYDDCNVLTQVINERNKERKSQVWEKLYIPGNDTNKCGGRQQMCCVDRTCVGPPESWMATVEVERNGKRVTLCGGVLLDKNIVLTTASCIYEYRKDGTDFRIVVGGREFHFLFLNWHPAFDTSDKGPVPGVALAKIHGSVQFNDKVKKGCLSYGHDKLASDAECGVINGPKVSMPDNCKNGLCRYKPNGTATMKQLGLWCKNKDGVPAVVALVPDTRRTVAIDLAHYSRWITSVLAIYR